jgi:hypothetical protein
MAVGVAGFLVADVVRGHAWLTVTGQPHPVSPQKP